MGNCCFEGEEDEYAQMTEGNQGYQPPNLMNTFDSTPQVVNNFSLIDPKELSAGKFSFIYE